MRRALEHTISLGTIAAAVGIVTLGVRYWRLLTFFTIVTWTLPRLVLVAQRRVHFSIPRFVLCWVLVPASIGALLFYTMAHIQFGGVFGQRRLYGTGPWLHTIAVAEAQGLLVALAIGVFTRALSEAVLLVRPALRPRAEAIWPILYVFGVTIALVIRYS